MEPRLCVVVSNPTQGSLYYFLGEKEVSYIDVVYMCAMPLLCKLYIPHCMWQITVSLSTTHRTGITLAGHQNKIISSIRIGRDEFQRQESIRF